jgi:hypothetical protein
VLEVPRKLPLVPPHGPAQSPPDWAPLQERLQAGHEYYDHWPLGRPPSQGEKAQVLDQCYTQFADLFEETLCLLMDVPRQRRSQRGAPARIKRVQARRRGRAHFQAWTSFVRPLYWIKKWVQTALRYVQGCETELTSAVGLRDDLQDAYSEFRSIPTLIQLYTRVQELTEALILDEHAGFDVPSINVAAFTDLLQAVDEVLDEELRLQASGHQKAWGEWVRNPVHAKTNGWAHRWTATRQPWRPLVASPGQSGQPLQILEDERRRLADIWGCQEMPATWFEAPPDAWRDLPAPTADSFLRAAKSFPSTTASTWDGFHPQHYALLNEAQVTVVLDLYRLMERAGVTPRQCRAIFGKLIPKHKAGVEKVSLRSIGLLPSLYRHWCRLRQSEARTWESSNKSPLLGHQSGRSIMETTFVQALRGEAAAASGQHSGGFLWDLANFYEYVDHEVLWQRARDRASRSRSWRSR